MRASSTSPLRPLASRDRRSSPSSSRRRCARGSRRRPSSSRRRCQSTPATGSGPSRTTTTRISGASPSQRALVSSDNSVYAQLTDLVGPKAIVETAHALGIKSPLDPYFSIGLGSVAVNPLEMARAYSTIANDGWRVDGSRVRRHAPRRRERRADSHAPRGRERSAADRGDRAWRGRDPHVDPPGRRPIRDRDARPPFLESRSRARRARRTTTATPGSSGTRPSSRSRSGSGTRTGCGP